MVDLFVNDELLTQWKMNDDGEFAIRPVSES